MEHFSQFSSYLKPQMESSIGRTCFGLRTTISLVILEMDRNAESFGSKRLSSLCSIHG